MPYTKEECAAFLLDTTRNPQSGRKIEYGKATYNKLVKECAVYGLDKKPLKKEAVKSSPKKENAATADKKEKTPKQGEKRANSKKQTVKTSPKPKKPATKAPKTSTVNTTVQPKAKMFEAKETDDIETMHKTLKMSFGDMVKVEDQIYVLDGSKLEVIGDAESLDIPLEITSRFDNAMAHFSAALFKTDSFSLHVNSRDIGIQYMIAQFNEYHSHIPKDAETEFIAVLNNVDATLTLMWSTMDHFQKVFMTDPLEVQNVSSVLNEIIHVLPLIHGKRKRVAPESMHFETEYKPKKKNKRITRIAQTVNAMPENYNKREMKSLEDWEEHDWEASEAYSALAKWANMAVDDDEYDIQIGDLIVMGDDGYRNTNIFIYDGETAIDVGEDSHAITIPLKITKHLKNALAHYKEVDTSDFFFHIHVAKNDAGIKYLAKHFKFPKDLDGYVYKFEDSRFSLCWGDYRNESCITIGIQDGMFVYDEDENEIDNHREIIEAIPYKY